MEKTIQDIPSFLWNLKIDCHAYPELDEPSPHSQNHDLLFILILFSHVPIHLAALRRN